MQTHDFVFQNMFFITIDFIFNLNFLITFLVLKEMSVRLSFSLLEHLKLKNLAFLQPYELLYIPLKPVRK